MYIEKVPLFYCTSRRKKGPAKRAIHLIFQLVYTVAMILATRMHSIGTMLYSFPCILLLSPKFFILTLGHEIFKSFLHLEAEV